MSIQDNENAEVESTPAQLMACTPGVFLTHVLAPVISLLAMGRMAWLGWGEFKKETLVVVVLQAAVPAFCSAGSLLLLLLRRGKPQPIWSAIAVIVISAAYCTGLLVSLSEISSTLPDWMVGGGSYLMAFAGMMIAGFSSLWRVGTMKLNVKTVPDIAATVFGLIVIPAATYVIARLISNLERSFRFNDDLYFVLFAGTTVLVFLFAVRLVGHLFSFFARFKAYKFVAFAETFVIAVVLPFLGLALNADIPFPADFQYAGFYALTAFTAATLLVPDLKSRGAMMALWFARWVALSFTLYFFLVFIPFLPFGLVALIFFGAGFLILSPTLLFWSHVRALHRTYGAVCATFGKHTAVTLAAVGLLLIPSLIAAVTEVQRHDLRRVIEFVKSPDYDRDAKLPIPANRARRAVQAAIDFNNGREVPLISAWYVQRVFDGMYLRDAVLADMSMKLTGSLEPSSRDGRRGDIFGSMFSRNAGRNSRFRRAANSTAAVQGTVSDTSIDRIVQGDEVKYTVKFKVNVNDGSSEFRSPVVVSEGAWITGMRLKIEDEWKSASIIERKAAEWVYNQIAKVQRRDPALLTLDSPTTGFLKVFPVPSPQGRELQIDVLMPLVCETGFAIELGGRRLSAAETPAPAASGVYYANGVLAVTESWKRGSAPDRQRIREGRIWVGVDCSATNAPTPSADIKKAVHGILGGEAISCSTLMLMAANAETKTTEIHFDKLETLLPEALLPSRTGLDAFGALYRMVRMSANSGDLAKGEYPRIVLMGAGWKPLLARVGEDQWRLFRDEVPGLTEITLFAGGVAEKFKIPGSVETELVTVFRAEDEVRLVSPTGGSVVIFSNGERPGGIPGKANAEADGVWGRGANAWRLQVEMDRYPGRDLRHEMLKLSHESGVLTKGGAYIVVENTAQEKILKEKQAAAMSGNKAFDFDESTADVNTVDAPSVLMMACALAVPALLRRFGKCHGAWR